MSVDVLIVDALESFRALLGARLEGLGCRVVGEAQNSKDGLEAFRRLRPRLCTLDLTMGDSPDFTAPDLFRKIREENPETAIIVVSVSPRHANAPQVLAVPRTACVVRSRSERSVRSSRPTS